MTRRSAGVSARATLAVLAAVGWATAARTQTDSARPRYTAADVQFMTGMIVHHAQAVLIAGWAPAHGAGPELKALHGRDLVALPHDDAFAQRLQLRAGAV